MIQIINQVILWDRKSMLWTGHCSGGQRIGILVNAKSELCIRKAIIGGCCHKYNFC